MQRELGEPNLKKAVEAMQEVRLSTRLTKLHRLLESFEVKELLSQPATFFRGDNLKGVYLRYATFYHWPMQWEGLSKRQRRCYERKLQKAHHEFQELQVSTAGFQTLSAPEQTKFLNSYVLWHTKKHPSGLRYTDADLLNARNEPHPAISIFWHKNTCGAIRIEFNVILSSYVENNKSETPQMPPLLVSVDSSTTESKRKRGLENTNDNKARPPAKRPKTNNNKARPPAKRPKTNIPTPKTNTPVPLPVIPGFNPQSSFISPKPIPQDQQLAPVQLQDAKMDCIVRERQNGHEIEYLIKFTNLPGANNRWLTATKLGDDAAELLHDWYKQKYPQPQTPGESKIG
ncbi:hypothetical protein V8C40DRAFT_263540 [Trichoderma camerunense]